MPRRDAGNDATSLRVGPRVLLRLPAAGDGDELMRLRRRSARHLRPWSPRPPRGGRPGERDPVRRLIELNRTATERRMLLCRRADGAILGGVSLSNIVRGPLNSCTLGYWLGVGFEGFGYMTEGLGLAFDHAFLDLGLHRVEANIRPENVRSIAVVRRLGLRLEGVAVKYLQIDGAYRDHQRWAVLAEEWRSRRRAIANPGAGRGRSPIADRSPSPPSTILPCRSPTPATSRSPSSSRSSSRSRTGRNTTRRSSS